MKYGDIKYIFIFIFGLLTLFWIATSKWNCEISLGGFVYEGKCITESGRLIDKIEYEKQFDE